MNKYFLSAVDKTDVKDLKFLVHPYLERRNEFMYFKIGIKKTLDEVLEMMDLGDVFYSIISSASYFINGIEYSFFQITKPIEIKDEVGICDRHYLQIFKKDVNVLSLNHLPSFFIDQESRCFIHYKR